MVLMQEQIENERRDCLETDPCLQRNLKEKVVHKSRRKGIESVEDGVEKTAFNNRENKA